MNATLETGTQLAGSLRGFVRRLWRRVSGADARLANGLLAVLSAEMVYKADCFDYLCCNCGKPQTYPGEHAECEDCGDTVCDSCLVAGVDVPGWHNGDFHCPSCASKREAPNDKLRDGQP